MIVDSCNLTSLLENAVCCKDGAYRPARPLPTFFGIRLRAAWQVLKGHAVAVYLYDGSESAPISAQERPHAR